MGNVFGDRSYRPPNIINRFLHSTGKEKAQ